MGRGQCDDMGETARDVALSQAHMGHYVAKGILCRKQWLAVGSKCRGVVELVTF